ncbi:alkylphosphonate utilization protein [Pasteurellaceae bacterium HPA106]|uniref:zinc ribbon domain-containing protein YjdM n=1 Tax=Spirabiliibacterium pneumoniae TaxID=221400 RepID=UPI001AAD8B2D|nr:zinc ribbon domain-containing protein YjdM [Spirabiliibacterium pneumoniae]MBE2896270.1 alkylphosphonate utilization protein [Spirabiliibacterium pneumoniae]
MESLPNCPQCQGEYVYSDGVHLVCPSCGFEWHPDDAPADDDALIVKDANGNLLSDGDSVILVKDLKVKGSSMVLKKGSKAKNIRLVDGDHNVDCKIDSVSMMLKSEFLKKAN